MVEFDPETMGTKVYDVKTVVETATEAEEDPQKLVDVEAAQALKKKAKVGDEIKVKAVPAAPANSKQANGNGQ